MKTSRNHLPLVVLLAATGCSGGGQNLAPAASAQDVGLTGTAAEARDANVHIVVRAEEWPGEALITRKVTPLRVSIENGGTAPLSITYDSFDIEGGDRTYTALPPFEFAGEVPSANELPKARVLDTTRWSGHGFAVAPYYRRHVPDVVVEPRARCSDPEYYVSQYPRWPHGQEALPTPEMLAWALPEGVLEPGGKVEGYLYFERLDDDHPQVTFHARLRDAYVNDEVASLELPFLVTGD